MEQLRRTSHERGRARAMRAKCHRTLSPSDELLGPTKRRAHWQSAIKVSWQTQVLTTCSWYLAQNIRRLALTSSAIPRGGAGGRGSNATDQEPPKTAHDPRAPQGRAGSKPIRAWVRACVRGEPTYPLGHRFFGFRVGVARHFGLLPTARPQAALDGGGVGGVATRAAAATHLRGHVNARARSLTELAQRRLPLQAATPRADKDVLAVLLSQRGEVLAARDGRQLGEHDRLCRVRWHGELVALAGARQETDLDGLRTFGVARRDPAAGQLAAVGGAAAVVSASGMAAAAVGVVDVVVVVSTSGIAAAAVGVVDVVVVVGASGMAAAAVGVVDVVVVVSTSGIADSQVDACGNVGGTSLGSSLGGGEGLASGGGGGSPGGYVGVRGLRGRGRKGRRRANDERGGRRGRRAVKLLRLPKAKISWLSPLGAHGRVRGRRWTVQRAW